WTPAIRLLREFGFAAKADTIMSWLLQHPLRTNEWGPFYEDIPVYSNTQINATAFARYLLDRPESDTNWRQDTRAVLDWTYRTFADSEWQAFGVYPIDEQTQFMVPGNSHTADYASAELAYAERTGDTSHVAQAIRELNWATYWVDS